jgi:hypothetical protein
VNGALGAKTLREHLDYVLAEGSNVGEIWARFQRDFFLRKPVALS